MVGSVDSAVTAGSSLEEQDAVGDHQARLGVRDGVGRGGQPKQKMLKMNERTHYVL